MTWLPEECCLAASYTAITLGSLLYAKSNQIPSNQISIKCYPWASCYCWGWLAST